MKIIEGERWHELQYPDGKIVRVMDNPAFEFDPKNLPISTTTNYLMDKEAIQKLITNG